MLVNLPSDLWKSLELRGDTFSPRRPQLPSSSFSRYDASPMIVMPALRPGNQFDNVSSDSDESPRLPQVQKWRQSIVTQQRLLRKSQPKNWVRNSQDSRAMSKIIRTSGGKFWSPEERLQSHQRQVHNPKPLEQEWAPDQSRYLTHFASTFSKEHVLSDRNYNQIQQHLSKKAPARLKIEEDRQQDPRRATFVRQQHMKTAYRLDFAADRQREIAQGRVILESLKLK